MICVSLTNPTTEGMIADARRAAALGADMVEFRIDYLHSPDVPALIAGAPVPEIITCRAARDGGKYAGDESSRIALLQRAIDNGADYVDVELDSVARIEHEWPTKLIVSVHDFNGTPDDLLSIHRRIVETDPDVVKIVTTARDIRDNLRHFELLASVAKPTIALAMGERGVISRILTKKFGGWLTFASLDAASAAAPGQVPISELTGVYRYRRINSETEVFGVVANPVAHSLSPLIHNAALAHCDMNAIYLPFLVDDATDFIARFRKLPVKVKGFSVTLPHKEQAYRSADETDPLARRIGAVNTLVEKDGRLYGTNTDCSAAVGAMEHALGPRKGGVSPLKGKRAAIIGARGTARAVAVGLLGAGARVLILNRTADRAKLLAAELGAEWGGLDRLAPGLDADVLINTTPVGMYPNVDESVVPPDALRAGMLVFDAVYNPVETKLIAEARLRGCLVVTGLEMFVAQGAEQFRLFTGVDAPVELMRSVAQKKLAEPPAK